MIPVWVLSLVLVVIVNIFSEIVSSKQFEPINGLYCGQENCYDVLGASQDSTRDDISRLYRSLAKKWHPDRFWTQTERDIATEQFRRIATAYEVLREEETRRDYDEMIENPGHYYYYQYRYYKRKVDSRWVLMALISLVSMYQYWMMLARYNEAVDYVITIPRYRYRACALASQRGLLGTTLQQSGKCSKRSADKKRIRRDEEDSAIRKTIVDENLVVREGYAEQPNIYNVLWFQLLWFPFRVISKLLWSIRWFWLFRIRQQPYGREEQLYLIRSYLNELQRAIVSQQESDDRHRLFRADYCLPNLDDPHDTERLLKQNLWQRDKFIAWRDQFEFDVRKQLAQSTNFRRFRRYMKKGGAGQITFLDD